MSGPPIAYTPRPDATTESELSTLAAAYLFILESAQKEGSRPGAPDDGTESKEDSADDRKYTG